MFLSNLNPLQASIFSLLAIVSLVLAFVMLGSHWLQNYVFAFAAESWLIAALSAAVGFFGHYPELYGIAALTALFRGLVLPYLLMRIVRRLNVKREIPTILQPSSSLVIGAIAVMFAFVIANHMSRDTRQTGVKRLMAYSSVEHLGVQALGLGFGGALGIAGMLYHMLNHSLNKSLMFFGAGNAMRSYETKEMDGMRGVLKAFPVTGCLWLAGAVAITGAPPFGLFLSEFTILRAGLAVYWWAVFLFLIFLIVVFISFLAHFRRMCFAQAFGAVVSATEGADEVPVKTLTGTFWRTLPMWLAFLPLLVLGVWWAHTLWEAFTQIAAELGGPR
jgi:hydrogenase-4 component F